MSERKREASPSQETLFVSTPEAGFPTELSYGRPLSPKKLQVEPDGVADIFPYYAGFSFKWATRALNASWLKDHPVVLDPWNGSGTTTLAASLSGLVSVGIDLNPVANIIARLRQYSGAAQPLQGKPALSRSCLPEEPLLSWFASPTAARLRNWCDFARGEPAAASLVGLVAIFRAVRTLSQGFQGSNPTWVRRTSADRPPILVDDDVVDSLIASEQDWVMSRLEGQTMKRRARIFRASATCLPLDGRTVDLVLTSPPYLTRIDYAVSFARELAVLDIDISTDRSLRSQLMGTTLIRPVDARSSIFRGSNIRNLVGKIAEHESKASRGYYLKQVCQYMSDLTLSFDEISRVCKEDSVMIMVVQDSYYKDVPVILADICEEEASLRGWAVVEKQPFEVSRTLTSLNRAARAYPKGRVNETVLTLRLTHANV